MIYECVVNVSNGKDVEKLNQIASEHKVCLDLHIDADHNRSVFTLASFNLDELYLSVQSLIDKCYKSFDFENHDGVHPRLGLIDVVPFVSYDDKQVTPNKITIDSALKFGQWINTKYSVPVFFYDYASDDNKTLPQLRKQLSNTTSPFGAVCIGARKPLIAINVNINSTDIGMAKAIAKSIRESSSGIKGVRAIGLELKSQNKVQVSMNIIDTLKTNAAEVCFAIRKLAEPYECEVELVGLVPKHQYEKWDKEFLLWNKIAKTSIVENALA